MTQTRMDNLVTLHVHKEKTDALDLKAIANEFTARNEQRRFVFGKFKFQLCSFLTKRLLNNDMA